MLYVIVAIVFIGIISFVIEKIKEYLGKIILFILAIVAAILLIKGGIGLFHIIGGWTTIITIFKFVGLIVAFIFMTVIIINILVGIKKSFAKIKIKKVLTEMMMYTSNLPHNIPYNELVDIMKEKYQYISVKPYDIFDLINKVIDTFTEKNAAIIKAFIEKNIKELGMVEYEEFYKSVVLKYGDYCVKDMKEVFDTSIKKCAEVISLENGSKRLIKAIGASEGKNFVSREIVMN